MNIRIALAGNPNCGKTTLFNRLTGSKQFVGNWPGVTVEKKEGRLKGAEEVIITDLPGIYSLSPYTLEEVVARKYLLSEWPDVILNIVDGTNLERNLYLTTQLMELGIPVVIAVNMMDVVRKNGDKINIHELADNLGCRIVEISALTGEGIRQAAESAVAAARHDAAEPLHVFSGVVEHALAHIEEAALHDMPARKQRWYAIKLFERDDKIVSDMKLTGAVQEHIESDIKMAEEEMDDDAESIITNERYTYISALLSGSYIKQQREALSASDKIDRIVTNRWAALPVFALIMFLVYFISVTTVGNWATDWANDGVFGDGWHLFGLGSSAYEEAMTDYAAENIWTEDFTAALLAADADGVTGASELSEAVEAKDYDAFAEAYGIYGKELAEKGYATAEIYEAAMGEGMGSAPDPAEYGIWVPGIPMLLTSGLTALDCAPWLQSLIVDGIVGGVGAVLGFVPQMLVLFFLLAFLESCGYMARVAFVLDRVFRKFGLSGKSFIPMLIGSGCGVPGIMASRTIENTRDRRMTIMTTTFIPCSAKLPIIALIAAALFGGAWWVAPSAYFLGIAAIIISGIMLKKTRMFAGDPAPFVMELPSYHLPTARNIFDSMWERASSFMKKAGTIIVLASIFIWAGSSFGLLDGQLVFSTDMELEDSILGAAGSMLAWMFAPLGFDDTKAVIATIMGLVAKEEVVGVFGVLDFADMSQLAAYSFLCFNLLCAPCFAAIGAIRREMGSARWTCFAVGYQCVFAYAMSLVIYQIGSLCQGEASVPGLIAAAGVLAFMIYMLMKPYKEADSLTVRNAGGVF